MNKLESSKNSMNNIGKFEKETIVKQWIDLTEELIGGKDAR